MVKMKRSKIVMGDFKEHFSFAWPFYAILIWFGGGSYLLHKFNPQMEAIGLGTSPGAEPFAMAIISIILGLIGFFVYAVYGYIKSVNERVK